MLTGCFGAHPRTVWFPKYLYYIFCRGVSPLKDLKATVGSTDAHGLLWGTPEDGVISKVSILYYYRGVSPLKDLKATVGSTVAHRLLRDTHEDGVIPKVVTILPWNPVSLCYSWADSFRLRETLISWIPSPSLSHIYLDALKQSREPFQLHKSK